MGYRALPYNTNSSVYTMYMYIQMYMERGIGRREVREVKERGRVIHCKWDIEHFHTTLIQVYIQCTCTYKCICISTHSSSIIYTDTNDT